MIDFLFQVYSIICLVYCLLSWFPGAYQTKLGQIIIRLASPYMDKFSKLGLRFMGLDFSPIVALILLNFARSGFQILFVRLFY
ncbi:MAG: YggT family protein [Streptococcaceae bacterium]|nr:YggT family protein [Streptococcaceae bacterium]